MDVGFNTGLVDNRPCIFDNRWWEVIVQGRNILWGPYSQWSSGLKGASFLRLINIDSFVISPLSGCGSVLNTFKFFLLHNTNPAIFHILMPNQNY